MTIAVQATEAHPVAGRVTYAAPAGVLDSLMKLVAAYADAHGEPVRLAHLVDAIEQGRLAPGVEFDQGQLEALCGSLGQRPRRSRLLLLLGDLVDRNRLTLTPEGIWLV